VLVVQVAAIETGLEIQVIDVYLAVGFTYPIVDIVIFEKVDMSPAGIPVAIVVEILHRIGKATIVNVSNLNINHVPMIELFRKRSSPN